MSCSVERCASCIEVSPADLLFCPLTKASVHILIISSFFILKKKNLKNIGNINDKYNISVAHSIGIVKSKNLNLGKYCLVN